MKKIVKLFLILAFICFFGAGIALAAEDPYYIKQWFLKTIQADEAWNITKGNDAVIVAVLDTGVDIDHPDIKDNIWVNSDEIAGDGIDNDKNGYIDDVNGWNFIEEKARPAPKLLSGSANDSASHGTFVAGLISALHDNGMGIKGVTGKVKIMPLAVLDTEGYGWSEDVTRAVDYAVNNGASFINLSFGGFEYSTKLKDAITRAYSKNVLIIAAAGNTMEGGIDLTNDPIYPICYDQEFTENKILGVLASDRNNRVTSFTNYGKGCVDIAAPGVEMISLLYQDSNYAGFQQYFDDGWQGNSFSTALVSGAAALLKSYKNDVTAKEIINLLTDESGIIFLPENKYADKAGKGVLNIKKALDKLMAQSPVINEPNPLSPILDEPVPVGYTSDAQLLVSTKANGNGSLNFYNKDFKLVQSIEVFGGDTFKGLNFQTAEVDGLPGPEFIIGAVKGNDPFVRVIDQSENLTSSFLAFPSSFKGGVKVAAGDVDNDGQVELVAAPESGFAPLVRIFNQDGNLEKEFYAFNKDYKNGMEVEVGDVDGDGKSEIVVAPHKGVVPKIKVFDSKGTLKTSVLVYNAVFTGGVNLSLADYNGDSKLDFVVGPGAGNIPEVRIFDYQGKKLYSLSTYAATFRGGVQANLIDWDGDGKKELITAPGPGGGPHVKVFNSAGKLINQFFPYSNNFTSGINIDLK